MSYIEMVLRTLAVAMFLLLIVPTGFLLHLVTRSLG